MELAFSPISLRMATARHLFSAAVLLEASIEVNDDTDQIKYVDVRRNSGLPTDALSMTREAGQRLSQALDGFSQLYPTEALRTDALRGAATGASTVDAVRDVRMRMDHWAKLARDTASLLYTAAPTKEQLPADPTLPRVSRRTSPHMSGRL